MANQEPIVDAQLDATSSAINGNCLVTFKDKRVLILGGTSGIGLAVTEAAVSQGAHVIVASSQRGQVDVALARLGAKSEGHVVELSDEKSVEGLCNRMQPFDHLVFTAGDFVWQRAVGDTELIDAQNFFGVRFWGALLDAKQGSKLIRQGGSIVLTSSTLSRRAPVAFAIGAGVSAAVEAFARALAVELAPVRVNVWRRASCVRPSGTSCRKSNAKPSLQRAVQRFPLARLASLRNCRGLSVPDAQNVCNRPGARR